MDRLPSSHHPDSCRCAQCQMFGPAVTRLNEAVGNPPLVRNAPCHGRANGCMRECCRPKARPANRTVNARVVQFPGKPKFAAARERDAA